MYLYVHLSLLCGDGAQLIIRIFCLKMHKWMQWAASNCYTHLLKLCAGIDMYVCICTHLYCALQKIDLPHFRVFFFLLFSSIFHSFALCATRPPDSLHSYCYCLVFLCDYLANSATCFVRISSCGGAYYFFPQIILQFWFPFSLRFCFF